MGWGGAGWGDPAPAWPVGRLRGRWAGGSGVDAQRAVATAMAWQRGLITVATPVPVMVATPPVGRRVDRTPSPAVAELIGRRARDKQWGSMDSRGAP